MQAPPAIFAPRLRRGLDFAFVALWTLFIFSGLAFKVTERWRGWPPPGNFVLAENRLPKIMNAVQTPIPAVYQAGQWTFSPSGLPVSLLTGKIAADRVIKDLKR